MYYTNERDKVTVRTVEIRYILWRVYMIMHDDNKGGRIFTKVCFVKRDNTAGDIYVHVYVYVYTYEFFFFALAALAFILSSCVE